MIPSAQQIAQDFKALGDPVREGNLQRFFKTAKGEYGHGDIFLKIRKRDQAFEERFLKEHYKEMPRTMLRYAAERFPETRRKAYLNRHI